ncbi:HAMP domain-containing histidine kinase [Halomonas sp. M5N1S17]|uniref:sensor histidine kinase n=1 Tax=Halomonas alkalisoli TaxID=2907158 RepID=UPI001F1A1098|nr:HAMP domain-containing sensor histidine kinase [Halomonas alkalisoli]MCE9665284.1 HAMP domain-containing histidine kinase [Halomonas alkalisoli]
MFDARDDLTLEELLLPSQVDSAIALLSRLCGTDVKLLHEPNSKATAVEFNLEIVAWLGGDLPEQQRMAAAKLMETLLFHAGKYRLAANLHHNATEANYEQLKQQHAALQASEARYRALSESLQERVDSQIAVIRDSQQKLYESARLRAVGQLAAGMAHEINTPVGFIASNLRTAQEYLSEIEEAIKGEPSPHEVLEDFQCLLTECLDGAARITNIIKDIRAFANIDQTDYRVFDLNDLVRTSVQLVTSELQPCSPITLELAPLPKLPGHPARVGQAIYNAVNNALRALSDDGEVVVTTRLVDEMVEITISDNGHGMGEEILSRAFEPFFTTRDVGVGAGLGLSVVRDVAMDHQGQVLLTSQEGQGSRLVLLLPIARASI